MILKLMHSIQYTNGGNGSPKLLCTNTLSQPASSPSLGSLDIPTWAPTAAKANAHNPFGTAFRRIGRFFSKSAYADRRAVFGGHVRRIQGSAPRKQLRKKGRKNAPKRILKKCNFDFLPLNFSSSAFYWTKGSSATNLQVDKLFDLI